MTRKHHPEAFYREYPQFIGKLLQDVSESLHHEEIQPNIILPELAGLWTAAATVMGLRLLQELVQQFQGLKKLVHVHTTSVLLPPKEKLEEEESTLTLRLGSLLHLFSAQLQEEASTNSLQQAYISYLGRVERIFTGLCLELQDGMINQSEHKKEIEALYLQSFYMLTRLSRIEH